MKYKTLVRVLLKLLGVYFGAEGLYSLLYQSANLIFALTQTQGTSNIVHYYAIAPISSLARIGLGAYFFLGGEWIVNKIIPSNRPYCHECGYDLTGAVESRCPECGTPFAAAGRTRGAEAE